MNTDEYREHIERLIREMSGEPVLNGSHGHASIIIERMFANATKSVNILSRRFDPRIYGTTEAIGEAELMLGDPGRTINILLEDVDSHLATHPFLERLNAYRGKNLEVRQMPDFFKEIVDVNFATMDDASFRFEKDKSQPVAVARFGDGAFTSRLNALFSDIWKRSEVVHLAAMA